MQLQSSVISVNDLNVRTTKEFLLYLFFPLRSKDPRAKTKVKTDFLKSWKRLEVRLAVG